MRIIKPCLSAIALGLLAASAWAQPVPEIATPKHHLFPGATNPNVTQATIKQTICKKGWTDTIRPPTSYTNAAKKSQMQITLHYTDKNTLPLVLSASGKTKRPDIRKCKEHSANMACWEEDHLISLELGGAPRDTKNLWPEPWFGAWNARQKDVLETKLKNMVCAGDVTLAEAQMAISTDWIAAYKKFVQP